MVMGSNEVLEQAMLELNEFFSGVRTEFNIPLLLHGTNFQVSVWEALLDIPLGQVATYAGLAHRIGNPKAVRAIGSANKANKIQIFLP
ncbi:MAG: methylated-DNA--[protein]-cysteine S-methyltransferase, partial [Porphyromonas sp.]